MRLISSVKMWHHRCKPWKCLWQIFEPQRMFPCSPHFNYFIIKRIKIKAWPTPATPAAGVMFCGVVKGWNMCRKTYIIAKLMLLYSSGTNNIIFIQMLGRSLMIYSKLPLCPLTQHCSTRERKRSERISLFMFLLLTTPVRNCREALGKHEMSRNVGLRTRRLRLR